jgi:4-hydroxy-tetrahydrodipicolinate reductase
MQYPLGQKAKGHFMRILLIGYGKMGQQIASLAPSHNPFCTISAIVSPNFEGKTPPASATLFHTLCDEAIELCDAVIDFSSPHGQFERIALIAKHKKPLVIGTTGWDEKEQAKNLILKEGSCALFSPNFSLGVALFLMLAKQAASLMTHFKSFDVGIMEYHHRQKQDAPSGTALKLAGSVQEAYPEKSVVLDPSRSVALPDNAIQVGWQRTGSIPGIHELIFDSPDSTILLSHSARNREGFANGALEAAFWLRAKKGWFTIEEMIQDKIQGTI